MNKKEIKAFIEQMEEIGDIWEEEDVKRVFGRMSLNDALSQRNSEIHNFFNIIGTVLNRKRGE